MTHRNLSPVVVWAIPGFLVVFRDFPIFSTIRATVCETSTKRSYGESYLPLTAGLRVWTDVLKGKKK